MAGLFFAIPHNHDPEQAVYKYVSGVRIRNSLVGMAFLQNEAKIVSSDMSANTLMGKCELITKERARRGDWVFKVNSSGKHSDIGKWIA